MGTVDLPEDMPSVDKQNLVLAIRLALSAVKKPERARKRDRIEKVRTDSDHRVDGMGEQQLFADFHFRLASIRRTVGHHESRPSLGIQSGIEQLDPQVVGV